MVQDTKQRLTYWNDALPPAARDVVDTCLNRILVQDWLQRRATIATTVADERLPPCSASVNIAAAHLTATIVAAIIERLETSVIIELDQAELSP